ncbi:MAG TPA: hypothetical protein VMF64_10160, partial [Steroidobacteraceae bacterium]|nr:hypothetical protein [Steroidobacteraceae bacterium]
MDVERTFDLSGMLSPLEPQAFFDEYWERKPLLLQRRGDDCYKALVSLQDLEGLIGAADTRYPAIRLSRGGGFFPPEAYTRDVRYGDEVFRGLPDVERILAEYSNGATVSLPALHLSLPAVGRFCAHLQAELDHAVHTNA